MAGYSVFRHAYTEVDYCFIVEDNICCLIINVKPELKQIKDLLLIVLPSSPAIANTFVVRSWLASNKKKPLKRKSDKAALICLRSHLLTLYLLSFVLIQKKVTKKKSRKKRYTALFFLSP